VLNQVQESYDGLGNIIGDAQSHSGAVSGSTPSVNYSYSQSTGELESMEYPNGRTLNYSYASGIDASIGRLSSISDASGTLQSYGYLGLDTPVKMTDGNGVSSNITLDTFGRVAEQKWTNASGTTIDDFSYLYDQDGNALLRRDGVNSDQSQLYQYDGLNRLVSYDQGVVDDQGDDIPGDDTASGSWQLDALGNWKNGRTNNAQNQVTTVGTATLSYDANGNTTTDQSGQQYGYDAWNRLVAVKNSSGTTIASYGYDALGRRITQTENGTTTDLYYSTNWQVVEERQGSTTTTQYVWSPFYVDQLIERDDQANGSGTLTRRLYAEQDADYNVTSITDSGGNVVERYSYDPYGNVTVENAGGSTKGNGSASASGYDWNVVHQGLMLDSVTGTYDDRNREYDPTLGRFLQQDPAGYINGLNRYQSDLSSPANKTDPAGTTATNWDWSDDLQEDVVYWAWRWSAAKLHLNPNWYHRHTKDEYQYAQTGYLPAPPRPPAKNPPGTPRSVPQNKLPNGPASQEPTAQPVGPTVADLPQMPLKNFKPIHPPSTIGDVPEIQNLPDDELLRTVTHPTNNDPVTADPDNGTVWDGNTRITELQRRAADPNNQNINDDTPIPL
jgi:RHS repeat-associated protein